MNTDNIIADLLDAMQHAIRSGDWNVDGACDPDTSMQRAVHVLRSRGWTQNSIDSSWMRPLKHGTICSKQPPQREGGAE